MARSLIGTSGWSYDEWKDSFYRGLQRRHWLRHYGQQLTALEINATFYGPLRPETLARWRDETPEGFVFALKGNRYVTHRRRLLEPEQAIEMERERAAALEPKLGAVLWQLPAELARHDARLAGFLDALARWPARHAIELRHRSWFCPEVAALLADRGVAACISDAADWPMWECVTADFVYVRLHGHTRTYRSRYAPRSLARWAGKVQGWLDEGRDVHVYFDNTSAGAAPRDALALRALLRARCLEA